MDQDIRGRCRGYEVKGQHDGPRYKRAMPEVGGQGTIQYTNM